MTKRSTILFWTVLAIAACAGMYLIGNGRTPLWDRDEPWYAQCSWKMVLDQDYVVPRYLDGSLRIEKPPLLYWMHVASMRVFGVNEFAVRFVSSFAMTVVLAIVASVFWRVAGPKRAAWTALILGTSVLTIAAGKMCLTDAVLLMFTTIAQMCLLMFYRGQGDYWLALVMAVSLALGFYVKGPIVLVAPAGTAAMLVLMDLRQWWERTKARPAHILEQLGGALVVAVAIVGAITLLVGPWALENFKAEPEFIPRMMKIAERHVKTGMEGHSGWPGYYFVLVWATFFPWSLLLPTAAYVAWKQRHVPETRFAIAAVLGTFICQEIMTTKLPHYVLAAFPFLAFLVADALVRCIRAQYLEMYMARFTRATLIWAIPIGLIPSLLWLAALPRFGLSPIPYGATVVLSLLGLVYTLGVWWFYHKRELVVGTAWLGGGFLVLVCVLSGWYIPQAKFLHLSSRTAEILRSVNATADRGSKPGDCVTLVYGMKQTTRDAIGWQEPTLDYYQGGTIRKINRDYYLDVVPDNDWPRIMVITDQIWNRTSELIQAKLEVVGKVRGFAYSDNGKIIDIMVVRRKLADDSALVDP